DDEGPPRYIETVPKAGYRFIAAVSEPLPSAAMRPHEPAEEKRSDGRQHAWIAAAVCVLALAVGYPIFRLLQPASHATTDRAVVAVLPLDDLSTDSSQGFLADGLTEDLITVLGEIAPQRLGVIARNSSSPYRGSKKGARRIAR